MKKGNNLKERKVFLFFQGVVFKCVSVHQMCYSCFLKMGKVGTSLALVGILFQSLTAEKENPFSQTPNCTLESEDRC